MAETSGFFDAVYNESTKSYDLEYFAAQFAAYFALFVGNGVFGSPTNQLKVYSGDGMNIKISPGWAFINGYWYHNDEELVLSVSSNMSTSPRSDAVLCRWDSGSRKISAGIQIGSTEVTRDGSYYDLKLAEILVPSGATSVPQSSITDTRMNESVCGLVTHILEVQTTEDLFAQYEAIFNEWFDSVKNQVTGDLAIRLQTEFTELNEKVDRYQQNTENMVTQYKSDMSTAYTQFKDEVTQSNSSFQQNMSNSFTQYQQTVNNSINAIQNTANTANQTIQTFVDNDFTIPKQTLTFVNGVCTITDERVTENSLVDVYFTAESMAVAEAAQIYVDSSVGKITLTANTQPTSTLDAMIRVRVM